MITSVLSSIDNLDFNSLILWVELKSFLNSNGCKESVSLYFLCGIPRRGSYNSYYFVGSLAGEPFLDDVYLSLFF